MSNELSLLLKPGSPSTLIGRRYKLLTCLGERPGCATFVCQDLHQNNLEKIIKLYINDDESLFPEIGNIFELCHNITHPSLVQMIDCGVHENLIFTITEGASLKRIAELDFINNLDEELLIQIIFHCSSLIECFHDMNISGCNIKANNIFLDEHSNIKITDIINLPQFSIKELVEDHYQATADYFELGKAIYFLLTGISIDEDFSKNNYAASYKNGDLKQIKHANKHISEWLNEIIMLLLHPEASKRLKNGENIRTFLKDKISAKKLRKMNNLGKVTQKHMVDTAPLKQIEDDETSPIILLGNEVKKTIESKASKYNLGLFRKKG